MVRICLHYIYINNIYLDKYPFQEIMLEQVKLITIGLDQVLKMGCFEKGHKIQPWF